VDCLSSSSMFSFPLCCFWTSSTSFIISKSFKLLQHRDVLLQFFENCCYQKAFIVEGCCQEALKIAIVKKLSQLKVVVIKKCIVLNVTICFLYIFTMLQTFAISHHFDKFTHWKIFYQHGVTWVCFSNECCI
jgi:hypothetical protein